MTPQNATNNPQGVCSIVFLSGPNRGDATVLDHRTFHLIKSSQGSIVLTDKADAHKDALILAIFHPSGEVFEIEAPNRGIPIRVSGVRIPNAVLTQGDILEIEQPAVLLRYGRVPAHGDRQIDLATLFKDCISRTRHEARRSGTFLPRFAVNMTSDLSQKTTRRFRLAVLAGFLLVGVTSYISWISSVQIKKQVEHDRATLAALSSWFETQQTEHISRNDLVQLREDITTGLSMTRDRLAQLEERTDAAQRIIHEASKAIIFLQGAYAYQEEDTGKLLRYRVSEEGHPMVTRDGTPLMTIDGDGPVVSRKFTGTAFVVSESGTLLTNRHVALPWEDDDTLESLANRGIYPIFQQFIGYLPEHTEPFEVSTMITSDTADLAVLQCSGVTDGIPHIRLAETPPSPGEEVIVLGYPTGLRALLARTSAEFVERVRSETTDFWEIATKLAAEGYIKPLASRGIVGQVSDSVIAYDADTTRGGSGGPVLNSRGELVAVNNAILPEYGGSNLGVPASQVLSLMAQVTIAGVTTKPN